MPKNSQHSHSFIIDCGTAARRANRNYWTMREWLLSGVIPRIEFPAAKRGRGRARPMRRLLCDVRDVDAFIEKCKRKA